MLAYAARRAVPIWLTRASSNTQLRNHSKEKSASSRKSTMQPAASNSAGKKTFTVAVEGCCHGELDNIYATLAHLEKVEGKKVDLLICCGDFQAVRNLDDLETMSVPVKYRHIMTFYKYYKGEAKAPVPTIFIGGNHEATNYLWELHYGGWAAPNIYFLGYSGAVRFGGHRIAGLSGTYVSQHYYWGHHEKLPYDDRAVKSAYHVRQLHVHKLMQLQQPTSIFLSHDWPNLITRYGNSSWLFKKKPYFKAEAERGDLGSPPNQELLTTLQPDYWFSAHLHVKFPAVVPHPQQQDQQQQQAQQPQQPSPQQQDNQRQTAAAGGQRVTRFLALDKCLPNRDFLQVIELPIEGPLELCYDPEWLAILRSTHDLMSTSKTAAPLPHNWGGRQGPKPDDVDFVSKLLEQRGSTVIPQKFCMTAPAYDPSCGRTRGNMPRTDLRNPQTEAFLTMLGLDYNLDHAANSRAAGSKWTGRSVGGATGAGTTYQVPTTLLSQQQQNPEEINIDSDSDDVPAAVAAAPDVYEMALDENNPEGDHVNRETEADVYVGGALADGAPDSDTEQQQQQGKDDLDDPMFGRVNTAEFPYLTS